MDADPSFVHFQLEVSRPDADIDLARAALAIARTEYPDLDPHAYLRGLDALAEGAKTVRDAQDPLARLHRLREYLFEEQGFAGNGDDYYDPRNSYLNEVLDRRLGIPITLALVLIEVGRRLDLKIEGIGLPGHFITGARVDGEQVLLDPFNGGAVLTMEACSELVSRATGRQMTLAGDHFTPVSRRHFLARVLTNLKGVYWRREAWDKVVRIIDRLLLVSPAPGGEWRDRGVAWSKLGNLGQSLADWEHYLTEFPNASDHDEVKTQFRRLRQKLAQLN